MSSEFPVDQCIVCGKRKQYGRKLQFFKFPYDIERCKSWVRVIGMRELLFMPIQKLRQQVVCAAHFDSTFISSDHLQRVALPSLTPYPTLSDEDMTDFLRNKNMTETEPVRSNDGHKRERRNETTKTRSELEPLIDYGRPLMESLGTLVHNERHFVKKPAGILNSIAVPLMAYSSSLEKGTVFAAADPGDIFKLPFVPFIEPHSLNEYKTSKRYTNVKAITDPRKSNGKISPSSKLESSVKESIKTTEPMNKIMLVGKVKPNVKPVEYIPNTEKAQTQRNYNISFGLDTLITGSPRNANKNISEGSHKPSIKAPEQRYKNIKQYSNNRLNIHSIKKKIPLIHNKIISAQETSVSFPQTNLMPKVENVMKNEFIIKNKALNIRPPASVSVTVVPASSLEYESKATADSLDANDNSATIESSGSLSPKPGASGDLTFVPYSQYASTVSSESPNAHTAEGTLDYGLPLMNCMGTVFQGNIQTTIKTENEEDIEVIDIPLMNCFKTLQHTND